MFGASLEIVTGRLGVGAICLLAVFLAVDAMQIGAFAMVETYGSSTTFGIVAALPTAVVAYILGAFCVGVAELALSRFPAFKEPDPEEVLVVSRAGGELLQQFYTERVRNYELLKGASFAFLLLAIGSAFEWKNMPGFEGIVVLSCCGALALSGLSLVFARRSISAARALSEHVRTSSRPAENSAS